MSSVLGDIRLTAAAMPIPNYISELCIAMLPSAEGMPFGKYESKPQSI